MGKLIKFCKWFLEHSTTAVFKNENVKVKVKYSFVLHTGLAGRILYGLKRMVYFMNRSRSVCILVIVGNYHNFHIIRQMYDDTAEIRNPHGMT
jgi:hypothetical protein